MKWYNCIFAMIVTLIALSCSTIEEQVTELSTPPQQDINYEVDTICIPLNFAVNSFSSDTRSNDSNVHVIPNWEVEYSDESTGATIENNSFKYKDAAFQIVFPESLKPTIYYLKYRISNNVDFLLTGQLDSICFYKENLTFDNYKRELKFTIPRSKNLSNLKIEFSLFEKYKSDYYNRNHSNLNFIFHGENILPNHSSFDSICISKLGYIPNFDFLADKNSYSRFIQPQKETISFYKEEFLSEFANSKVNNIFLKVNDAFVLILTDEFNDYIYPYTLEKYDHDSKFYHPYFISSLDYKVDRKISEYMPDVYEYAGEFNNEKSNFISYHNIIHDPVNNKSYILPIHIGWKNKSFSSYDYSPFSYSFPHYSWGSVKNMKPSNLVLNDINPWSDYTTSMFRQKSTNRKFILVSSQLLSMPYGKPYTLSYSDNILLTHLNKQEDKNKQMQYIIINASQNHSKIKHDSFPNLGYDICKDIPIFSKAIIPIPENGFKPGYVYIITNKPGTKMFKEWDEENATTRGGESDYIVDESCLDIEEIQL